MIAKPTHVDPARPLADEKRSANGNNPLLGGRTKGGRPMRLLIVGAILLISILAFIPSWIQKWLWMRQLGYTGVFWTLLSVRWELFCGAFVVALLYLAVNFRLAAKNVTAFRAGALTQRVYACHEIWHPGLSHDFETGHGHDRWLAALIFAVIFYAQWDTYLRFRYGGSFGLSDPLFGADVGFYLFRLPFYELLQGSLTALALITLLAVLASTRTLGYCGSTAANRLQAGARRPFHICPHCSSSSSPVGDGGFTWITSNSSTPLRE